MAKKIISKKELAAEQAAHPGQSRYRIYKKTPDGKAVDVNVFWARSAADAFTQLEIYKRKIKLIDPNDTSEYFYTGRQDIALDLGNGMVQLFDSMESMIVEGGGEKNTFLENLRDIWWCIKRRLSRIVQAFFDLLYWLKHYEMESGKSRQRFESWNLDKTILDMLEFNVPIIIKNKNGIPNEFCEAAKKKVREKNTLSVAASFGKNPNLNCDEFKIAEDMWNDELNRFLTHIRLYRYYESYGTFDKKDLAMVELDKIYKDTIPTMPGTDGELDYTRLHEMTQSEWRAIWRWISKYGQSLWIA